MDNYDLCVIGAGSGGLVAATTGNRLGLKTVLVEKNKIGGECTHSGCVPSKAFIQSAKLFYGTQSFEKYGLPEPRITDQLDFARVMEHVDGVIQGVYQHETPEIFENMGIDVIVDSAGAEFQNKKTIRVGDRVFRAENTIICTGSSPRSLEFEGSADLEFLNNENFWALRKIPRSITFVGGGVISAELGQAMRRFGAEVNIIEHNPRILKVVDDDVADEAIQIFRREGVRLFHNANIGSCLRIDDQTIRISLDTPDGKETLETEAVFLAIGRQPNIGGLGLKNAGVAFSQHGIETNQFLQTTAENVYACGDAASPAKFTHAASYQAEICVQNILKKGSRKNDLSIFPWAIFTDPEIAHVGLSEKAARKQNGDVEVLRVNATLDRFTTDGKTEGFLKIVLGKNDQILGADAIGAHSGEWIQLLTMAMKNRTPIKQFAETIFAYPTYSEIVKKAFVRYFRTK